jgi:ABC-type transport system involved in multi-copper enzyme maturation permease subunit
MTAPSWRRVRAVVIKEFREYRRNRQVVMSMAILPLVFLLQPLIAVIRFEASSAGALLHEHVLLYLLGIPTLVPVFLSATAVAGERQQGTLEPVLTTPIRREELLLGKAVAALAPSLVIAYAVFALFLLLVAILAKAAVVTALLQGPDLLAQVLFTPLLAAWTTWVGIAVSTRTSDARVAQQLGLLASLPTVFLAVLIAVDVIHPTVGLGAAAAAVLIVLDVAGWRIASLLFDRERLITGTR